LNQKSLFLTGPAFSVTLGANRMITMCSPAPGTNPKLCNLLALLACALVAAFNVSAARAAEGAAGSNATGKADEVISPETRSLLQLQQQVRETQMAVDRNHKESTENAVQNTEALATSMKATTELANRMKTLEESLSAQRSHELDLMQGQNRTMLIVAGVFASFGFVALLLMGYFQWRTVSRLAEISAILPPAGLPVPDQRLRPALTAGDSVVTAPVPTQTDNSGLLETIARLERRINELEHGGASHGGNGHTGQDEKPASSVALENNEPAHDHANGAADPKPAPGHTANDGDSAPDSAQVMSLLNKGQSLLDLDKTEDALACFDEALSLEPDHAEALVKKGAALERLRKLNEAIECYDRAIKADNTMTIAYLYKGGLCNRLERFNEALQCYEQALRTQEKRVA
jgi:tetratricopeptide (TPR) repeat protein